MQCCNAVPQRKAAVRFCSAILQSHVVIQCCNAMLHCNVALQCCICRRVTGDPPANFGLECNAITSKRAIKQASKQATIQLQCHAAWQCHNSMLRCRWVIGDPPQNIGLQCNATQRKVSQQACRHAGRQASKHKQVGHR